MKHSETAQVLAYAQAFDQRTVGDADVLAWQGMFADDAFEDVREAVKRHYLASADRVMPAHIRALVAEIGQERQKAARKWEPGQYGIPVGEALPEVTGPIAEGDVQPSVMRILAELRTMLPEGSRDKLMPRTAYWEREQRAYLRSHSGEPNPLYRPGTWCGVPSPHPEHTWSIAASEGEGEPDEFWCRGIA